MAGVPPNIQQAIFFPDDQLRLQQLQAQQAYAQALMQKGMGPAPQGQQVGQVYAPPSWTQQLSHALQPAIGAHMTKQTMKDQAEINQSMGQKYAQMLSGVFGSGGQQPAGNPQFSANMDRARMLKLLGMDDMALESQKQAGEWNKPTATSLTATQGGVDPAMANRLELSKMLSDPEVYKLGQAGFSADEIKKAMYGAAAKAAEIDRKAGNQFANPLTGESGFVPKIPENANPVGGVAPNGALPGGVVPMPGALPIVARQAGAVKGAQEDASIITVTTPDGSQIPVRAGPAARAGGAQVGLNGGGGVPSVTAFPQGMQGMQPSVQPGMLQPAVAPQPAPPLQPRLGQSIQDKATQEAGAKALAEMPAQLQGVKQAQSGLENALGYIAKSGPGISKSANVLAVIQNMGIPLMKDDTNGYMTLKKFLENSAAQAASAGGFTGSDARFEQFKAGQPNAETMTPQALKGAIQYVLSQHDAALARGDFLQKFMAQNQGDPNAMQKAQQAWVNTYTPKVFEFSRMDPQERIKYVQGLDKAGLAKFTQQYNAANQQGWVQ